MYLSFVNELINILMFMHTSFVNENDLNKKTLDLTYYIDIKSKELRDILRIVLQDIRTINLNEDKFIIKLFFNLIV